MKTWKIRFGVEKQKNGEKVKEEKGEGGSCRRAHAKAITSDEALTCGPIIQYVDFIKLDYLN